MARREFDTARRLLDEAIARDPKALLPRVMLSYVLLQEGNDLAAAGVTWPCLGRSGKSTPLAAVAAVAAVAALMALTAENSASLAVTAATEMAKKLPPGSTRAQPALGYRCREMAAGSSPRTRSNGGPARKALCPQAFPG